MNDDQLIQLLQEKTPEELSLAEIELLRQRLRESDDLRTALLEHLEMEEYLATALGRVDVSVDAIAGPEQTGGNGRTHPVLALVVAAVCIGLIGFISLVIVAAVRGPGDEAVAVADGDSPDGKEEPADSDGAADGNSETDPPDDDPRSDVPPVPEDDDPPAEDPPPEDDPPEDMPPAEPEGPWTAGLAAPPVRFADTWYADFDTARRVPDKDDLQAWFEPVPNAKVNFNDLNMNGTMHGAIQGVARLKAPWPENAALRFSTSRADLLRIHCYGGTSGISIYWNTRHGGADRWAAYLVTREEEKHVPLTYQLVSTDESRDEVSDARYGPTLLLRWHDSELVLTRGDVELVRTPFPGGPPEDVYFEAQQAAFRGIEMLRLLDSPDAPYAHFPQPYEVVQNPAELNWAGDTPEGSALELRDDGGVQLANDNGPNFAWAAAPLPVDRVRFVEVELNDVHPGAQIYLGPPEILAADGAVQQPAGRPNNPTLTFAANNGDQHLVAEWKERDEGRKAAYFSPVHEKSIPYVGERTWVRFLVASGWVRCWISPDGEHWALLNWGNAGYSSEQLTHLGIACSRTAPGAKLTVRQIRYRELPQVNSLINDDMLARAKSFGDAHDYTQWLLAVTQSQPGDVDANSWRIACAVRTLATGGPSAVSQDLLDLLLRTRPTDFTTIEEQLELFSEIALLVNPWTKVRNRSEFKLPERVANMGREYGSHGGERPMTMLRHSMMTYLPQGRVFFKSYDPETVRYELIQLAYTQDWRQIERFLGQLKFYGGTQWETTAPLAPWLELLAARQTPGRLGEGGAARLPEDWRNPLVEHYNKDAYNVMAEFHAAVESESYEDASRMIADLDPYSVGGLVPSANDGDLLVSVATAIRSAMARDRQLANLMNADYTPLGKLRVRQAAAAGDEAAVQLATVQFHGTEAAGMAHRWLGDRALAAGEFVAAVDHFNRAAKHVGVLEKAEIAPRVRLAGAMLGADVGQPQTAAVTFGDVKMTAQQFESLVAEMRQANEGSAGQLEEFSGQSAQGAPKPLGLQVHKRGRFDGEAGESPNGLHSQVRKHEVPWLARQLGITQEGSVAYVNNRFHVAAYDLAAEGKRLWQSKAPPNRGRTHDWSMTDMRPVIDGEQVIVRQLSKEGPLLLGLSRADGNQTWIAKPPRDEFIVTDPMLSQGKLFALTLQKAQRGDDLLRLNVYATDTGDLVASHNLLHVRTSWQQRKLSRATQLADGLVATLGGFVVNVGFDGNVRWARRQTILPASQEPTWITQRFDRPLVSGGRTFIHTPGVRAVECLETDTGRLLWRQVIANIDRLIGIAGENLIVNHGEQLLALGKETGILAWSREMPNLLDAEFCSDEGILVARKVASQEDANQRLPRLVWLNPINGEVAARTNLMDLVHADPRFGPLLRHGDNVWTFWAGGADEPHRDLIQLQPQGEPDDVEDAVASVAVVNPWYANTQEELRAAVSNRFPEWTLLSAVQPDGFELVDDAHGEKNLVALPAYGSEPTVLGRELTVPKTGQPRLRLRVGNEPNHHWRLTVRLGEEVVMEKEMKWDDQPEVWKNVSVDLNTVAGQSGWLTVEARHVGGGDHVRTYWKQLDLQF